MITFLYGNHGTGKTEHILACLEKDAEAKQDAILLVPEQMTVTMERHVAERLPAAAQMHAEVLNFTRLCNRVFRQVGGLVAEHANSGVRLVTMQRALSQVGPLLEEYKSAAMDDAGLPAKMLSVSDEFTACGISPADAEQAAKLLGSAAAGVKLRDIATVLSAYRALLAENYTEPAEDLARLADLDTPKAVFGNVKVYLDGFSGLTGIQHRIVRMLMQAAKEVTVSVPLPSPDARGADTLSVERMSDRLRADAAAFGNGNRTVLFGTPHRYHSPEIALLSAALWTPTAAPLTPDAADGAVRLLCAADAYDEAEACAAEIRKLVRDGYRFRDIAVIARNADSLRGIADRALEDAGISVFLSEKMPLSAAAPGRFLLSALKVLTGGWQREDVLAHVKTGLCGIPAADADLFEIYCETWHITGKAFTSGDWQMNPDGYTDRLTARAQAMLDTANHVRRTVCNTLQALSEDLAAATDAAGVCAALYRYMQSVELADAMNARARAEAAAGKRREAEECARVYGETVKALEDVYHAYGDALPSLPDFTRALRTVLDARCLGTIPTSADAVTVGSADMLRADAPRCVILLGVADGEFPAIPAENGLFSTKEREELKNAHLPLLRDLDSASSDELYFLRRAAAFASDRLIVFTRQEKTSVAVSNLRRLLPRLRTENADADITDRILSPATAAEYAGLLQGTPEADALHRVLSERGERTPADNAAEHPVSSEKLVLAPEAAAASVGSDMVLSQSKLECFLTCPFKYYCRYTLKLTPRTDSGFTGAPIGTFVHAILEQFLREIYTVRRGVFPEGKDRDTLLSRITADLLERIAPKGSGQRTARLEHLTVRMRHLVDLVTTDILHELTDSDFVPAAFELRIGNGGIPPLRFPLKTGGTVALEGIIDRVDIYRKDGVAYLRTVDYKTGKKEFKLENIEKGENLQLLLYLYALTRGTADIGLGTDGLSRKEGAFTYISANMPRVNAALDDPSAIADAAIGEMKRSGAVRADGDVMQAVSRTGDERYLMGNEKKRNMLDEGAFDAIFTRVSDLLCTHAEEIRRGVAAAIPKHGGESCKYCEYADVCRSARKEV